jgi:CHAD domain-containing protein
MPTLRKAATDEFDSPLKRLLASIANLRQQPTSKGAHFYRTSLRRFQAWSDLSHPHLNAEQQQSLGLLDKLRKATGKLRDSEVLLELLESLTGTSKAGKEKLEKELKTRRKSARKKVKSLLKDSDLISISEALRVFDESPVPNRESSLPVAEGARIALQEYRSFVRRRTALSPENLHEYRLECKRFRYTAELAGGASEGEVLIAAWKGVQDIVGEWHDYLMLSKIAKRVLGDSRLHTTLLARMQRKYEESLRAIARCEEKLLDSTPPVPKKEPKRARSSRRSSRAA